MDQISRKTGEVAAFPLKLNLQLFADENDGTPSLEDSPEFAADAREFNSKMEKYVEERQKPAETEEKVQVEEKAVTPEVADPEPKLKQDPETNKAFQEMRKKAEEAERRAAEVEAKAKRADELIAQQYGDRGIFTVEQYEAALKAEREADEIQRYEAAGLTPEEIQMLKEYPDLKRQTMVEETVKQEQTKASRWNSLYEAHPDLKTQIKEDGSAEWYTPEMHQMVEEGNSPLLVFEFLNKDKQKQQVAEAAKQAALNSINSKSHIQANGNDGSDVDHVEIDDETMRMYRSLNKGKSDSQIRAWHKKNAM